MNQESQTKEKLLRVAKEEFMEKGYASASLRNICKRAEVTTGALYFFFKDKNDLFGTLVKEPIEKLYQVMKQHYKEEMKEVETTVFEVKDMNEDRKVALEIVDYLYEYHDEFVLLITKSQGSQYENCIHDFVNITERHIRSLVNGMSELYQVQGFDENMIHWFSHVQIFSFVELITHNFSKEQAVKQINFIVDFLLHGWFGVMESIRISQT